MVFSREEVMESPDPNTPTETPILTAVPSDETNDSQLQAGIDSLAVIFGLEDSDLIAKRVQMYSIKEGTVISHEGDQDPSLYYVVKGRLIAEQEMGERKSVLYEAVAGSLSGQLSVLTGEPTFFKTYAKVGFFKYFKGSVHCAKIFQTIRCYTILTQLI